MIAPKWFPVKIDWIENSLAVTAGSLDITEGAQQRFGTENGIQVKRMSCLERPRPEAQFGAAIVRVAEKTEAEKLL